MFVTLGLLAILPALGCCLADGIGNACGGKTRKHRLLGASEKPDFLGGNKTTPCYGYIELVEGEL